MSNTSLEPTPPGRHCPLAYRTTPGELAEQAPLETETLYVIGGLYGNTHALDQVRASAAEEVAAGLPRPLLVFNGDFHWFNAEAALLRRVQDAVLAHTALRGNIEQELADPDSDAGCGCAYPDWVDAKVVERSNGIMTRLQKEAARDPNLGAELANLPRTLRAHVGGVDIGIVHGDPESLAGWGFALEHQPEPGTVTSRIARWFRSAAVDLFACSHTCVAYMQDFDVDGLRRIAINNGAAGMPNLAGDPSGVITRVSVHQSPHTPLYGTRLYDVSIDALAIPAIGPEWLAQFDELWPPDSPAALSYRSRLIHGPDHTLSAAWRITGDER